MFEVESGSGVIEGNFKRGERIRIPENVRKVLGTGDDERFGDAVDLTESEWRLQKKRASVVSNVNSFVASMDYLPRMVSSTGFG